MNRFSFRLDRILWLRSQAERERARALGSARLNEELRKRLLEDAHERLQEFGEQIAAGAAEVQTAGTLRNLGLTVTDAADRLEAASTSHEEAREKVLEEEGHYREARKDRRVLEKLRERRRKLWDQELSREEQKDVDSQARHLRRAGEKG